VSAWRSTHAASPWPPTPETVAKPIDPEKTSTPRLPCTNASTTPAARCTALSEGAAAPAVSGTSRRSTLVSALVSASKGAAVAAHSAAGATAAAGVPAVVAGPLQVDLTASQAAFCRRLFKRWNCSIQGHNEELNELATRRGLTSARVAAEFHMLRAEQRCADGSGSGGDQPAFAATAGAAAAASGAGSNDDGEVPFARSSSGIGGKRWAASRAAEGSGDDSDTAAAAVALVAGHIGNGKRQKKERSGRADSGGEQRKRTRAPEGDSSDGGSCGSAGTGSNANGHGKLAKGRSSSSALQ
ncbi:unnamed protein product, partial [Phaeothamnion confervicola]